MTSRTMLREPHQRLAYQHLDNVEMHKNVKYTMRYKSYEHLTMTDWADAQRSLVTVLHTSV